MHSSRRHDLPPSAPCCGYPKKRFDKQFPCFPRRGHGARHAVGACPELVRVCHGSGTTRGRLGRRCRLVDPGRLRSGVSQASQSCNVISDIKCPWGCSRCVSSSRGEQPWECSEPESSRALRGAQRLSHYFFHRCAVCLHAQVRVGWRDRPRVGQQNPAWISSTCVRAHRDRRRAGPRTHPLFTCVGACTSA